MAALQAHRARRELHGRLEGRATAAAMFAMCTAAALLGVVAYAVWAILDALLGRGVLAQIVSVGGGLGAGAYAYARATLWLRIDEARQTWELVTRRLAALQA
jgi:hypothetical protein